ncbi:MAG: hypothetical protein AAF410_06170 [Pseudomonadota bacterium]
MEIVKKIQADVIQFLFWVISLLPLALLHGLGSIMGTVLYLFNNRNKHIGNVNLSICFPTLSAKQHRQLLKKSLKENAKTMLETFWLWKNSKKALSRNIGEIKNQHILMRAKDSEKGTIFITPHFGSWEFVGLLTAKYCDLWILYAPSKSIHIDRLSRIGRTSTGATLISTTNLNLKNLIRHLKSGGCVGILPDQVPEGKGGEYANFFHRRAYTSTLACKLAQAIKCHVVIGYGLRNPKNPRIYDSYYFEAPEIILDENLINAVTGINQCIEKYILSSPENYIWGYKRFKKPAPGDTNPY